MRGADDQQNHIFSYLSPEERVRNDHPLRAIRAMVDEALTQLSGQLDAMYASVGRPSIAPEKLLRAQLLQMLYSVRSERLLMEEMDYNLLFRWFVGLNADDEVWDATTFTKNRDRLLEADVARQFLAQVVAQAGARGLTSDEHFTVDGTLLEAWASAKSFQSKAGKKTPPPDDGGNPTVNFHGEKRCNQTHESKTDPEAKLARKGAGKEAKLSYCGNLLVENRNGLIVDAEAFEANGTAERDAALVMLEKLPGTKTVTVGGDKGFDTSGFVVECRNLQVTPHVAQNHARPGGSAIDARTTRHAGYKISQRKRKRIEECFGWLKTIALLRKVRHRGSLQSGLDLYFRLRGLQLGAHAKPGGRSSGGVSPWPKCVWLRMDQSQRPRKTRKPTRSTSPTMRNGRKTTVSINFSAAC
jgi:transposase